MPTYQLTCRSSQAHTFDHFLTFAEYDACKGCISCPKCGAPTFISIPDEPAHGHLVNRNTVGFQADENTKKLGKYGHQDKLIEEAQARKPLTKKKKAKQAWYGALGKEKAQKILKETNEKTRSEKINKYVQTGEL